MELYSPTRSKALTGRKGKPRISRQHQKKHWMKPLKNWVCSSNLNHKNSDTQHQFSRIPKWFINGPVIAFLIEATTISIIFPAKTGNQFKEFMGSDTRALVSHLGYQGIYRHDKYPFSYVTFNNWLLWSIQKTPGDLPLVDIKYLYAYNETNITWLEPTPWTLPQFIIPRFLNL